MKTRQRKGKETRKIGGAFHRPDIITHRKTGMNGYSEKEYEIFKIYMGTVEDRYASACWGDNNRDFSVAV